MTFSVFRCLIDQMLLQIPPCRWADKPGHRAIQVAPAHQLLQQQRSTIAGCLQQQFPLACHSCRWMMCGARPETLRYSNVALCKIVRVSTTVFAVQHSTHLPLVQVDDAR